MTITKNINGNEAIIAVDGWLDTKAAPDLLSELNSLDDGITNLVLDFSGLEYISSSGVRTVVSAYSRP